MTDIEEYENLKLHNIKITLIFRNKTKSRTYLYNSTHNTISDPNIFFTWVSGSNLFYSTKILNYSNLK